jgi:addiction module RelE/StbE family toxin
VINVTWDSGFKNSFKQRIRNHSYLKTKFWDSLEIFTHDPLDSRLKTHKLSGKLNGLWAFSVSSDCRVIFRFYDNNNAAILIDIGSHEEVY